STCPKRSRSATQSARRVARERLVLAVRGGDEQLAMRALEAAVALCRAFDDRRLEVLVAVRTLDVESRSLCLAHTASVATRRPTLFPEFRTMDQDELRRGVAEFVGAFTLI